jgi:hypothetical protein
MLSSELPICRASVMYPRCICANACSFDFISEYIFVCWSVRVTVCLILRVFMYARFC